MRPQLLSLLEDRGRKFPDQIGQVGDLLANHGFVPRGRAEPTRHMLPFSRMGVTGSWC